MRTFPSNLHKMCAFSWKCMHFHLICIKYVHFPNLNNLRFRRLISIGLSYICDIRGILCGNFGYLGRFSNPRACWCGVSAGTHSLLTLSWRNVVAWHRMEHWWHHPMTYLWHHWPSYDIIGFPYKRRRAGPIGDSTLLDSSCFTWVLGFTSVPRSTDY